MTRTQVAMQMAESAAATGDGCAWPREMVSRLIASHELLLREREDRTEPEPPPLRLTDIYGQPLVIAWRNMRMTTNGTEYRIERWLWLRLRWEEIASFDNPDSALKVMRAIAKPSSRDGEWREYRGPFGFKPAPPPLPPVKRGL